MRWVLAGVVAFFAVWVFWPAGEAAAQGRIVARHGDWQIRCETPVGSPSEQCALVQNVEAQDRANVGLTVIFLRTADQQARILRVLAPLGVLLPSGLGLSIDNNEVGLAGFVRCLPEGCIAEVELDDGLQERFGAGETATFVIFQTPEEGIGIPISLNGFTSGFAALDNPPPPPDLNAQTEPTVPREAVPTTVEAPATPATTPQSIAIPADERSDLERLLEDPMLPYIAAVVVMVLAVVIVVVLIARRGRAKTAEPVKAPRRRERPPEDGLETLQTGGRSTQREAPRLAPSPRPRQLAREDGGEDDLAEPREPAMPRAPRQS